MKLMGLEAIYPKPKTGQKAPDHKIYPYLLKNYPIERPSQVWSTSEAQLRLSPTFRCLMASCIW